MKKTDISSDEILDKLQSGRMSRRNFNKILGAAGISMVMTPMMSRYAGISADPYARAHRRLSRSSARSTSPA